MDQSNQFLMERLESLERSNRRLKLASFVLLVAIGTMGAAVSHTFDTLNAKQITAQGIQIVDANGKLRLVIGADAASDQGGMTVYQRTEIARASIGLDTAGDAAAAFYDASGTIRSATGLYSFGGSGPVAMDQNGISRAAMIAGSGGASIGLTHPNGNPSIGMSDPPDGSFPSMGFFDLNGTLRIGLAVNSPIGEQFEFVRIYGPDGILRASTDSGFSASTNGLVHTFDAFGVENGLLGVP